jgi:Leucine-rich repeat (LRR) protein
MYLEMQIVLINMSLLQNSFPKLYELHTILLNHNNITDISKSVFTPLFSVRLVYIQAFSE